MKKRIIPKRGTLKTVVARSGLTYTSVRVALLGNENTAKQKEARELALELGGVYEEE